MVSLRRRWEQTWMRFSGLSPFGRVATRLAACWSSPYKAQQYLARLSSRGFISPTAVISHKALQLGANVFIGDHVVIYQSHPDAGPVELGDRVHIHSDVIIEVGQGGSLIVGSDSNIQPRCQISPFGGPIRIGKGVQVAPFCAFYPYNHGYDPGQDIKKQPLVSRGGIIIEDDAWLGVGVKVLDGVRIGKGAVIGAGAVVTEDVPDFAIAVPNRKLLYLSRAETTS